MVNITKISPTELSNLRNLLFNKGTDIENEYNRVLRIVAGLDFGTNDISKQLGDLNNEIKDVKIAYANALSKFNNFIKSYVNDYLELQQNSTPGGTQDNKIDLLKYIEELQRRKQSDPTIPGYDPSDPRNYDPRDPRNYDPRDPRNYDPRDPRYYDPRDPRNYDPRDPRYYDPRDPRYYDPRDPYSPYRRRYGYLSNKLRSIDGQIADLDKQIKNASGNTEAIKKLRGDLETQRKDLTGKIDQLRTDFDNKLSSTENQLNDRINNMSYSADPRLQNQASMFPGQIPNFGNPQGQFNGQIPNPALKPQVSKNETVSTSSTSPVTKPLDDAPYKTTRIDLDPSKWDKSGLANEATEGDKTLQALGFGALGIGTVAAGGAALYAYNKNKEKNKEENLDDSSKKREEINFDNGKY